MTDPFEAYSIPLDVVHEINGPVPKSAVQENERTVKKAKEIKVTSPKDNKSRLPLQHVRYT
jgi:hypothetical protein